MNPPDIPRELLLADSIEIDESSSTNTRELISLPGRRIVPIVA